MSGGVCAVMLVKDEADIIETTINHLLWHVDEVIVADNMSSDGTAEILDQLRFKSGGRVIIREDPEVGYYQDRKTTALAMEALARGHRWVLPCDADEIWQHNDHRLAIRDYLAGVGPDVMIFNTPLYNHISSDADVPDTNPVRRIVYRQKKQGMNKIVARLRPDLQIDMGNHGARLNGFGTTIDAPFNVRHFSWRSREQFLRKIRNGCAAYAATTLHPMYGKGWRDHEHRSDDEIREIYDTYFTIRRVTEDTTMIWDPAPLKGAD